MTSLTYAVKRSIHADHTATELISTGDFATDTNWTDFTNGSTGGTVVITGGQLVVTQGSNSVWMGAYQAITTVSGLEYTVSATVDVGTTSRLLVNTTGTPGGSGSTGDLGTDTSESTSQSVTFTATGTTTYIFLVQGAVATTVRNFDDATCQFSGTIYKDLNVSALQEEWPTIKNTQTSLDGTPDTLYHRGDTVWNVTTTNILRSVMTSDYWRELVDSIRGTETFTFDHDGTIASPVSAGNAILESFSFNNVDTLYVKINLRIRML